MPGQSIDNYMGFNSEKSLYFNSSLPKYTMEQKVKLVPSNLKKKKLNSTISDRMKELTITLAETKANWRANQINKMNLIRKEDLSCLTKTINKNVIFLIFLNKKRKWAR